MLICFTLTGSFMSQISNVTLRWHDPEWLYVKASVLKQIIQIFCIEIFWAPVARSVSAQYLYDSTL